MRKLGATRPPTQKPRRTTIKDTGLRTAQLCFKWGLGFTALSLDKVYDIRLLLFVVLL